MEMAPTVETITAAEMEAADTAVEMVAQNQTATIAMAMAIATATNLALIKNNVIKCLCVPFLLFLYELFKLKYINILPYLEKNVFLTQYFNWFESSKREESIT